jgi:hypothetical protein
VENMESLESLLDMVVREDVWEDSLRWREEVFPEALAASVDLPG